MGYSNDYEQMHRGFFVLQVFSTEFVQEKDFYTFLERFHEVYYTCLELQLRKMADNADEITYEGGTTGTQVTYNTATDMWGANAGDVAFQPDGSIVYSGSGVREILYEVPK